MSNLQAVSAARVIVFVGPSYPAASVARVLPHAEVRPPIRRGDIEKIDAPAIVAIIDGVFDAELAVSPREIRAALGRGIRVLGASSMGALRAAEVHEMLGVGRIYQMYRSGAVIRDDEVAVLLDLDTGRALTEPLVNVRFAVARLVAEGSLASDRGKRIIEAASSLHFHDRVYRNILRKAELDDLTDTDQLIAALRSFDLKREDAQSLLEQLEELATSRHWEALSTTPQDVRHEYRDRLTDVRAKSTTSAESPTMIWECGEEIDFRRLVAFLAVTGKLDTFGRRAALRYVLGHGDIGGADQEPHTPLLSVQQIFGDVASAWGWGGHEEVHVTLNDLGFGEKALGRYLRQERQSQKRLLQFYEGRSRSLLRALRFELLINDLSLKRETMRLGALEWMSARATAASPVDDTEVKDARLATLCERPELTWKGLLAESGTSECEAQPVIELLARARRVGVPIIERIERAPRMRGECGAHIASLPCAPRADAITGRSMSDEEAAQNARVLADKIGVTRIAQIGELERFGLHVTSAYRMSSWSSTVGSGKSETLDGAVAGCVMEEVEKYCQERFAPPDVRSASFREMSGERVVDPSELALPYDSQYAAEQVLDWTSVIDLASDQHSLIPVSAISLNRQTRDILYSPRLGTRVFSTNGLASGFTLVDALVHACCEVIERDAVKLAEQSIGNPGRLPGAPGPPFSFVDLASCPPSTQRIAASVRGAGFEPRVMNITSEVTVPTFAARIVEPSSGYGVVAFWPGWCAHPNPEVAINRALLECIQSRLTQLSGAREDLGLRPRSLGRHERPRPMSTGDAYWFQPYVPKSIFGDIGGFIGGDARDDLTFIVRRLTAASFDRILYRDMSLEELAPARVVRVIVPGMESTNPFYTGPRARALLVRDLMHRHAW